MKVDEFGDYTLGCMSNVDPRTKYWHGPLVAVWHMLCKMTGHRCEKEVASITDDSEKPRPDVVVYRLTENTLFDVRTVCGGERYCRQEGQLPGFGAQWGAHENNKKWLDRWTRQGDQFIPLSVRLEEPLALRLRLCIISTKIILGLPAKPLIGRLSS